MRHCHRFGYSTLCFVVSSILGSPPRSFVAWWPRLHRQFSFKKPCTVIRIDVTIADSWLYNIDLILSCLFTSVAPFAAPKRRNLFTSCSSLALCFPVSWLWPTASRSDWQFASRDPGFRSRFGPFLRRRRDVCLQIERFHVHGVKCHVPWHRGHGNLHLRRGHLCLCHDPIPRHRSHVYVRHDRIWRHHVHVHQRHAHVPKFHSHVHLRHDNVPRYRGHVHQRHDHVPRCHGHVYLRHDHVPRCHGHVHQQTWGENFLRADYRKWHHERISSASLVKLQIIAGQVTRLTTDWRTIYSKRECASKLFTSHRNALYFRFSTKLNLPSRWTILYVHIRIISCNFGVNASDASPFQDTTRLFSFRSPFVESAAEISFWKCLSNTANV